MGQPSRAASDVLRRLDACGLGDVARGIARSHYVDPMAMLGTSRSRAHVLARDALLATAHDLSGRSSVELGGLFSMDHTSVLAAIRRHRARVARSVERVA